MLSLLKPKLIIAAIIALVIALVIASVFLTHKVIVHRAVKKAVAETQEQMSAEYTKKLLEASELAREREQVMVSSADKIRKEKDAQIASLNTKLSTALDGVRQRPERPSSSSQGSSAPRSCEGASGAELSKSDAEVLIRLAGRADRLRAALDQCYKQYDSVRESLK